MKIVGPAGNLMFFLQAYEIFAHKTSGIISLPGFTLSFVANASWLIYGLLIKNQPIIISCAVATIGGFCVLVGAVIYPA
ncbi:MAG: SemiSWEET family transporter [Rickettsiaceae bacterium]|nr:SemiSWEET family transporter [Rickettsiaceae bacterium]